MKDLVLYLTKNLVDHPEQVEVTAVEENGEMKFSLKVAEEDKGKIIGKQGKVIKAIRSLVSAAAAKRGKKATVEIE